MPSLTDLESKIGGSDYEVVIVNRKIDPALEELMQIAHCIELSCPKSELVLLIQRLAELVTEHLGGHVRDANLMLAKWMERSMDLRTSLQTTMLPIGSLRIGLSRHRALLFKALADSVGLPCRLVKGSHYTGVEDDAVNVVKLQDDSECLVDLMGAPGTLIPADALSGKDAALSNNPQQGEDNAQVTPSKCSSFYGCSNSPPPNLSIITEFLPRGSLYRIIHRPHCQIDERRRIKMALDVAKGMNCLHTSIPTIVHRDLKSPNLLVDNQLECQVGSFLRYYVQVGDCGLSRLKHNTFLSSKSTAGIPEWMAPEVLRNEPSNEKCDVYSFDVILWELATLKLPWTGMNPMQVVGAVGFQHRRLDIPKEMDPLVARIIWECWQMPPSGRTITADEGEVVVVEEGEVEAFADKTSVAACRMFVRKSNMLMVN
ncbi:Serine/threonine-protein kinase EDR1 [Striga hermonthica]|uniref:Serine/threonine-protein kinase EDR1 n=1 Tax=Striga hermonthica TaxID=68872 RepID=A0A9N7NCJ5_STRHE|nr:Serine/threonine-protein kinase EDR1 [Striga hermonthica]